MRIIDADALEEKIINHVFKDSFRVGDFHKRVVFEMTKGDMYKHIKDAPTIDVVPLKQYEDLYAKYLKLAELTNERIPEFLKAVKALGILERCRDADCVHAE